MPVTKPNVSRGLAHQERHEFGEALLLWCERTAAGVELSSSAIMSATRIGLCHLLAGAKHLDLGQAQVVCAGELHANIPAIRTGGSDGGGGIGNRGLMALPGSGPFL